MLRLLLLAVAASVSLTGCSAIDALSRASAPQDVFEIRAPSNLPVARGRPQNVDLVVEIPAATSALDTESIMVRPSPIQIQYLPDARWSEAAPLMLQSAIVEGLERTAAFRFVGRRPLSSSGDVALVTTLLDFQAETVAGSDAALVRMTLVARLVHEDTAAVVASRRFSGVVSVPGTSNAEILAGYVEVGQTVLLDLTEWVLDVRRVQSGPS